jgi:hypothetical protein
MKTDKGRKEGRRIKGGWKIKEGRKDKGREER